MLAARTLENVVLVCLVLALHSIQFALLSRLSESLAWLLWENEKMQRSAGVEPSRPRGNALRCLGGAVVEGLLSVRGKFDQFEALETLSAS